MSLARLAETVTPTQRLTFTIVPTSSISLNCHIKFHDLQRPRLQLSARKVQEVPRNDDMGEGGKQWNSLNVSVERKKRRCAECTRPLPDDEASALICQRCSASLASASQQASDMPAAAKSVSAKSVSAKAMRPEGSRARQSGADSIPPATTAKPPHVATTAEPPAKEASAHPSVTTQPGAPVVGVTWADYFAQSGATGLAVGVCIGIVGLTIGLSIWRRRRNRV
jgi:hypothetical protein